MSLFSKIEVKPEMESFIAKGEGVGIVKVDNYGKASARIESHKIILESYKEDYPIIESISAITLLSYDPGNFFQEPKLVIGLSQKEYTLAGVDDNDDELEAFYKSVLNIKKNEKKQQTQESTNSKVKDKLGNDFDELEEVEEELDTKSKNDTASKIKGFLSKRFDDSGKNEVKVEEDKSDNKNVESKDLELILDNEEDDDDFIVLEEEKIEIPSEKTEVQKIEDMDDQDEFDEIDDFDDFEVEEEIILEDDMDSDTLIVEEDDDDEIVLEDEIENDSIEVEDEDDLIIENTSDEETQNQQDSEQSENKPETGMQGVTQTNELKEDISQAKEQVSENITAINQEISDTQNQGTDNFDPVYQIRRYYELKEDGIITEEEFELKKKQLLEL